MKEIKVNKSKTMTKYHFLMFLNKNNMKISLIAILTANVSPFILSIIFKGGSIPIYVMLPYFIFLITAIFTSKIVEEIVYDHQDIEKQHLVLKHKVASYHQNW